jgi:Thiopurine S-methyltransferase (TPMT)
MVDKAKPAVDKAKPAVDKPVADKATSAASDTPGLLPTFATRDPDAPAFWDERFERGVMPWDQRGVPPAFCEFAERQAPGPVLIPGCGSAYEAGWLANRGWSVTALDFSAAAVVAARTYLASQPDGEKVSLVETDFFTYEPSEGGSLKPQWIYERAFLCALPPARRADYARHMAKLAAPGVLLAGLFFFGETRKGPPFAIEESALHSLLTPFFECIDDHPVEGSIPVFAGRERWLTWRRRAV